VKILRACAVLFGLIVIGGELLRSWGERDVIWWIDDVLVATALIATALVVGRESFARRALFTGAWGFSLGVIYINFFDKVIAPAAVGPGAELNRLNIFVGFCLVAAIAGFAASLMLPFEHKV